MRLSLALAAFVATASAALAQTPTGPFTGQFQEDFEGPQVIFTPCMPNGVFSGNAAMCTPNGHSGCHTTTGWSFFCLIAPAYSNTFFFGSADGAVEFTFTQPATKFGGYFGTNSGTADATVDFYDANSVLLGSVTAAIPADCSWNWQGWTIGGGGAARIVITGLNPWGGGFIDMDALEVDFTSGPSVPVAYCTSGTSTNGCEASISANVNPNVSHTSGCLITVDDVEGQKSGILFYGLTALPQPWCSLGGGTSFLCVKPPTQRTIGGNSGGTTGQCDGHLTLNWDAFQLGLPGALGQPWVAGSKAYVQGWYRDPASCKTTSLSDALEMTYQP